MNQNICSGSLAVETACPNRDQHLLFSHSSTTRVNHLNRSKWAAKELCASRDDFDGIPLLLVGTNSQNPKKTMRATKADSPIIRVSLPWLQPGALELAELSQPFQRVNRHFSKISLHNPFTCTAFHNIADNSM